MSTSIKSRSRLTREGNAGMAGSSGGRSSHRPRLLFSASRASSVLVCEMRTLATVCHVSAHSGANMVASVMSASHRCSASSSQLRSVMYTSTTAQSVSASFLRFSAMLASICARTSGRESRLSVSVWICERRTVAPRSNHETLSWPPSSLSWASQRNFSGPPPSSSGSEPSSSSFTAAA
ncbi:hypothetical protein VTK26DRAFT_7140 [Humicola hyalothermophila]